MQTVQIEYQCLLCKKRRILFLPEYIALPMGEEGYVKLYDIHDCSEGKTPFVLYVDNNYAVRAQTQIKTSTEEDTQSTGFNIPVPKKTEYPSQYIPYTSKRDNPMLLGIEILDQLRGMQYYTTTDFKDKIIEVSSKLGYVKLKASVFVGLNEEETKQWLESTANEIEEMPLFDVKMLDILFQYLNDALEQQFTIKRMVELDLLLTSPQSIPFSTEEQADLFSTGWQTEFPEMTKEEMMIGKQILRHTIDNVEKTLLEIYNLLKDEVKVEKFFEIIAELVFHDFLVVQKLEFVTVT